MKRVAILGSTGSIGKGALKVIDHLKDQFCVVALAAKKNIDLLEEQAKKFKPQVLCVYDETKALELQKRVPHIPVVTGKEGLSHIASFPSADLVLNALFGFDGVEPTLRAIESGKDVALANKEALVAAGKLVLAKANEMGVSVIPIDSEHTAIFQCLKGEKKEEASRIILTASGGPFLHRPLDELKSIGVDQALSHPNYRMGAKVSIDSSTMMNKGLEMIEAHYLYDLPIDVVIHREQILHSMVEFIDGSMMAQMGEPDMLVPIQVALTHPERKKGMIPPFDFTKYSALHFAPMDFEKFRCLQLAYSAIEVGGSMPCKLNAANEVLVERFLQKEIGWLDIGYKLETLMEKMNGTRCDDFIELQGADREARELAQTI